MFFFFFLKMNDFLNILYILQQAVGGNIMTASPISDLNPLFMAAGCHLTVGSKVGM